MRAPRRRGPVARDGEFYLGPFPRSPARSLPHRPRTIGLMNILVLQLKRIGDLVLTTPALGALRTIIPEARVTLAVSGSSSSLLPAIDGIDRAIVLAPGGGLAPWRHVLAGRWEVCLDFTGSDRSALAAALSRARRRIA